MTDCKKIIPHSIFNDVLGPIMAGPSSSHSAGCARIGLTTNLLYGKKIEKAVVVFDAAGSYPSTYIGQGSNFGFTGGLMGLPTDHPQLKDAVVLAQKEGRSITFAKEMLSHRHPNEARIDIYDDNDQVVMQTLTLSTGGGTFEIVELDGFPVYLDGSCRKVFVECTADSPMEKGLEEILKNGTAKVEKSTRTAGMQGKKNTLPAEKPAQLVTTPKADTLYTITGMNGEEESALDQLLQLDGCIAVRHSGNVLPVPAKEGMPVFTDAAGAVEYNKSLGKTAAELAMDYELSWGNVTGEEVLEKAAHTLDVMERAAKNPPDPEKTPMFGFLPYRSLEMKKNAAKINTVSTGCLDKALFYAISVMENSCAHNTVVAAPTAGSSGVIPAAILAVGESMELSRDQMIDGLLASGLAGAFIANLATFGAEVAGCQAENGAASAMAAAGVVQLLGGTVEQTFMAASMAMQNMLGLICDPVGGLTEIPCISRNVSAVSNAITAANMVMLGFDPVIPLDESILAMYRVGQQLPAELRCTCGGGLCTTPTGLCLARRNNRK